jgi:hypothetical protein
MTISILTDWGNMPEDIMKMLKQIFIIAAFVMFREVIV